MLRPMLLRRRCALLAVVLLPLAAPAAAGVIEGTVRAAANGAPLAGRSVSIRDLSDNLVGSATTDGAGRYEVSGLEAGAYYSFIHQSPEYLGQYYPLRSCSTSHCGSEVFGEPITLGAAEVVAGIDFSLERPAAIEGTVTDAVTGAPLQGGDLVFLESDLPIFPESADPEGRYRFESLVPGRYRLAARDFDDYVDEDFGTPIDLGEGEVFVADFELEPGGILAGSVVAAVTGEPLPASVNLWTAAGMLASAATDGEGRFEFRGLGSDTYYLTAEVHSGPYRAEIYDDVPCPNGSPPPCDPRAGTGIAVTTNSTTVADFELDRLGRISGTVLDGRAGLPVAGGEVEAEAADGSSTARGSVREDGSYTIDGLPGGSYHLIASAFLENLVAQLYPGIPCVHRVCDRQAGTAIPVALNGHVEDVHFTLPEGGGIEGTVVRTDTGEPLPFRSLMLFLPTGEAIDATGIDELGGYRFEGLATGSYRVTTDGGGELLNEVYDGVHCPGRLNCRPEQYGTPVHVSQGATTGGIDFSLEVGGRVTGRVEDAATGGPTFPLWVQLWSAVGDFMTGAQIQGEYSIGQLPAGSYRATTLSFFRYDDELYDDRPCPTGACPVADGDPIDVQLGETTSGVDFLLEPFSGLACSETDGKVCLNGGRFQTAMRWSDSISGDSGEATGVRLTDDSAYFWFFDQENVEALVKIHDACVPPFRRFWVFAAGLTNVATELEVIDTWSGASYLRDTPQGPAFPTSLDTSAFDTCSVSAPSVVAATRAAPIPERLRPLAEIAGLTSPGTLKTAVGPGSAGPCVAAPTRLCLGDGRFAVEAIWETPSGEGGAATAVPLTSETGTFWFFAEDNVEILIKILDACVPPFDRYWVFAAGLTNVEVTLRVTDLVADVTREYVNPQARPFAPIQDTGTFDTCD